MNFNEHMEEWELAIGKVIIQFGYIELVTYQLLVRLPSDRIFESVKELGLCDRIDLLLEIMSGRIDKSGTYDLLAAKLKQAKKLSETRNLIAHNALDINFEYPDDGQTTVIESTIAHAFKNKSVSLVRVKECGQEAFEIAGDLGTIYSVMCYAADQSVEGAACSGAHLAAPLV